METEENEYRVTGRSTGIRFGLLTALVMIAFFLVMNLLGVNSTGGFWNGVTYVIIGVIIFFAHQHFKRNRDGYMSYGEGIGIGFWIGLVSALITNVFRYVYIRWVDGSFMDLIWESEVDEMRRRGLSEEQIQRSLDLLSAFLTPEVLFGLLVVASLGATVIIALIVTIFTQKKNPEPAF